MNWMKYKWLYFFLSALVLIPGIFSLIKFGLRPSVDFTGGTLWELRIKKEKLKTTISNLKLKEIVEKEGVEVDSVQASGEDTYLFRMRPIEREKSLAIQKALKEEFGQIEEVRFETVGPLLGRELLVKTLVAVVLAAGFILLYVAWRFKEAKFGVCAILAMFHDTLILLGSFSLLGHFLGVEIDTLFVTAVLTILSFSVHDTVVVYDKIREERKLFPQVSFEKIVNKAITETIVRSLNNSLTIIFMLVALLLLGGETIRWFVVALLIGTIAGTYSSTFTAAPLLVVWEKIDEKRE